MAQICYSVARAGLTPMLFFWSRKAQCADRKQWIYFVIRECTIEGPSRWVCSFLHIGIRFESWGSVCRCQQCFWMRQDLPCSLHANMDQSAERSLKRHCHCKLRTMFNSSESPYWSRAGYWFEWRGSYFAAATEYHVTGYIERHSTSCETWVKSSLRLFYYHMVNLQTSPPYQFNVMPRHNADREVIVKPQLSQHARNVSEFVLIFKGTRLPDSSRPNHTYINHAKSSQTGP